MMDALPISKLRIVVLDCPYDTWNERLTKEIFHKLVNLKISGYRREYPYGVLPIDTSDFIGTHHILCLVENNLLEPVMAYRTITLERSKIHRMALPVLTLMKLLAASKHEMAIRGIIGRCEKEKKDLSYASSLTVHAGFKGHPEIREILKAMHVLYHNDYGIPQIIGGGVLRFKVDRFYKFWGYNCLALGEEILPPLPVPFVFDEITGFYHLEKFSSEALIFCEKYRALWEGRITISANSSKGEQEAA